VPLFRDSNEFAPTLDAAAERLGISATAVEKDYWVSEVLRVLARDYRNDFIFKGGTSLSKAYRIVERFSEDIDVLVVAGDRGRGTTDKLMKAMGAAAAAGVGGEALSVGGAETGRHRSYSVTYPATREPTALIQTSVLLEMGVRGGHHPHESVAVGSLLGDVLAEAGTGLREFADLEPFEVAVLHPGRTLLEKLVHIHALGQQLAADSARRPDRRSARHFYDVFHLLGDSRVLDFLSDRDEFERVIASIEDIDRTYFGRGEGVELRPAAGFASSAAFDLDNDVSRRLRAAYEVTMPELHFGTSPPPTWEDIGRLVAERQELL
jgi:predicted nucleotidyltransferase component of viral defense system